MPPEVGGRRDIARCYQDSGVGAGRAEAVYPSKQGDVTFNHALHAKRVNNNCKACHDRFFPESSAPLNYKAAEHKTAEAAKTSCAGCHYPGGDAFQTKGNCVKRHVKN